MEIRKLTNVDSGSIKHLFMNPKYMGVGIDSNYFVEKEFASVQYENFCDRYISGLKNYCAFGSIEDKKVTAMISSYQSLDNPEWYWTQVRSINAASIKGVFDAMIDYQESCGRLKFYSMFNIKYRYSYRRFAFSEKNKERYDFIDEFTVPAKTKCLYTLPWMVLYNRTLIPVDTIVRCTFLKQQYRNQLLIGGNI